MVVYLDGWMGLNFLVDWMLLLGVNRLAGYPPGPGRTAAAAAVGGGYAGMCLVPEFGFLAGTLWRGISLGVMSMTAFGLSRSAIQRGLLFVLLSMALGGLTICVNSSCVPGLIGCAGALGLLCRTGFRGNTLHRKILPVEIRHNGRKVHFYALCDTGNTLRDPITGEIVLVAAPEIARQLLDLKDSEIQKPADTVRSYPEMKFRLVNYGTVGNTGLMLAVRCQHVTIEEKSQGTLVAFSPVEFGNGEYQGLTGGYHG